jgi:condensin-2 complex subunit G2
MDNHLSLPFLKKLLPQMETMVHDPSERVRAAFFELLLVIKGVRDIKFYDVIPIDHLLARLEVEPPANCKRLVRLLGNSFFPANKEPASKAGRLAKMAAMNPGATRVFARRVA